MGDVPQRRIDDDVTHIRANRNKTEPDSQVIVADGAGFRSDKTFRAGRMELYFHWNLPVAAKAEEGLSWHVRGQSSDLL